MPRLGATIPNFKAETTHGPIDFYDFIGDNWAILFSHPSDFTPVCTTELGRIASHYHEFQKRNTKLIALSCDDVNSHVDWVNDIKNYCPDIKGEFPFAIIGDEHRDLAVKLDLLDEQNKDNLETAITVRALYIIGPDKKLKLSMVYPASTGRNVDEILRALDSLQLFYKNNTVVTPANWKPGDKVMIHPAVKDDQLSELFPKGVELVDMPSGVSYVRFTTDY